MSGTHSFASTSSSHRINSFIFVFHIDVVLLCIFALYVVFAIPRALVYFFQPSEFLNGFFLRTGLLNVSHRSDTLGRSGTTRSTKPMRSISTRTPNEKLGDGAGGGGGSWKTPSGPASPPALIVPRLIGAGLSRRHIAKRHRAPTRVPRWATIVHPSLAYVLNLRVAPGFSLGKLVVILAYTTVMLYATLYHSNPFTDPLRAGYVVMSQIPIVVAFAGKTNCLSWISGVSYQKLNFIHRYSGRVTVALVNVHVLGYFYKWALNGTIRTELRVPKFLWGLIALGAVDLLFASSLSFVRNRVYGLFHTLHIICVALFLVATYKHAPTTLPYIVAAAGLFGFDRIARIFRTRYTNAWLTAEHALNGGTTLVYVPSLGAGWRAGQHVRLRVVSSAWFGWWTTWLFGRGRPFTIAAGSGSVGLMLSVKVQGSWSRRLLDMSGEAADARPKERFADTERGRGPSREVRVIVEGPYGGPGYTLYSAYSGVVLVAGGSGISYVLGVLDDLLQKHACGRSRVRVIEVVWSVMDPDSLYSLLPELMPLMHPQSSPHNALSLRFNVHWTRTSSRPPAVPRMALPQGMYLRPGRPDILATLQNAIAGVTESFSPSRSRNHDSTTPSGIVIGTCGPTSLVDDATRAVGRVNWSDWGEVGGVESIEEVFGL